MADRSAPGDWRGEYLRKSREEEKDPEKSLEILANHHALLTRTAAGDGVTIPAANVYQEIGSGEWIDARPEFLRLLAVWEALRDGIGGVIYVMELSRLSRGLMWEQGRVMKVLMQKNIWIRTPTRYYDLRLFEDRQSFMLEGIVSNSEYELIKRRFARGKHELLLKGRVRNARVPFGYDWVKGAEHPIAAPDEFPILRLLCRDALHMSTYAMGEKYGLRPDHVRKILQSPTICGYPAQRYRRTPGTKIVTLLPREEWIWPNIPGEYPAACTREEWEAIQTAMARRERGRERRGMEAGWCRDVVRWEGQEGRVALGTVNQVPTYELYRKAGSRLYVPRALVHAAAEEKLRAVLSRPALIRKGVALYLERRGEKRSSVNADAEALVREIEKLRRMDEGALTRELEADADGDREEASRLAEVRGNLKRDLVRAKATLGEIQRQQHAVAEIDGVLPYIERVTRDWKGTWANATNAERRTYARAFLASVDVVTEPVPGQQSWRREVAAVRVRNSWLE
jgi:DNA invertase Pin-like site-specific DNA recombinase